MRINRPSQERDALALVSAYLAGASSLQAAVAAVQALGHEIPEAPDDYEDVEPLLGMDLSMLTPTQRARYETLVEALHTPE